MTNYERIKAEWTIDDFAYWLMCPRNDVNAGCLQYDLNCRACTREWLEQECDT